MGGCEVRTTRSDVKEAAVLWEFNARLRSLRKAKGMNQEELALAIGVTSSHISRLESENEATRANPSAKILQSLVQVLGVTISELTGLPEDAVLPDKLVEVPVLGRIPAGKLQFTEKTIEGYRWERAERVAGAMHFYLRVKGNCMYPRFQDGDLALVRVQPEVENGDIGIVVIGEHGEERATMKKVFVRGDHLVLRADNPEALENPQEDPLLVDSRNARIIGKVVGGAWGV